MLFSVSLELRCVFGFWESYPDCLWFVPNFLERRFNLIRTVSDFQSFTDSSFAEVFLAEHFVIFFLIVISLQFFFGKNSFFRYFLEEVSLQSLFGGELLFCDFPRTFPCSEFLVVIFLQIFSVHTFSSEFLFE